MDVVLALQQEYLKTSACAHSELNGKQHIVHCADQCLSIEPNLPHSARQLTSSKHKSRCNNSAGYENRLRAL